MVRIGFFVLFFLFFSILQAVHLFKLPALMELSCRSHICASLLAQLRYRPQTPLVLKGINLTIQGGHKVGVVGRTGSGKSTLILALFRLVEAAEGAVFIDNVDISTLGLNDLRSRLSIIPQDPTLFDGTVRTNIDPLGEHTDPEIWTVSKTQCPEINVGRFTQHSCVLKLGRLLVVTVLSVTCERPPESSSLLFLVV